MKTKKNILLRVIPFILAILLPSIDYFNSNSGRSISESLIRWGLISIVLLAIWYLNSYILKRNPLTVFFINLAFIGFVSLLSIVLTLNLPKIVLFPRIILPTVLFIAIQQSFKAIQDRKSLITENLMLKSETYKAELDNLRNQINPHFLFNSLSTLQTLIRQNSKTAEDYLIKLSDFYRRTLMSLKENKITLKEELDLTNSFIFLLESRFENGLRITIDTNEKSLRYFLPIFALQLIIENCIKHNIVSDDKPLSIHISQKNETSITVENNLQPKLKKENSAQTGLANLSKRYELMGIKDGLSVTENNNQYSVTLKLF